MQTGRGAPRLGGKNVRKNTFPIGKQNAEHLSFNEITGSMAAGNPFRFSNLVLATHGGVGHGTSHASVLSFSSIVS